MLSREQIVTVPYFVFFLSLKESASELTAMYIVQ